jgi:hypothetical protein
MEPTTAAQPKIDDTGLSEIAAKRQKDIQARKKRFNLIVRLVAILIVVGAIVGIVLNLKKQHTPPPVTPIIVENPPEEIVEEKPVESTEDQWTLYKSEELKVFVKYPKIAMMNDISNVYRKIEIVFQKDMDRKTVFDEKSLTEGYLFRISPLTLGIRNLDEIARIKMDSFRVKCPTTAQFSDISKTMVDTVDARTFAISNCDGDYVVTYVPRFGIYYEFVQFYKGNFGIRQQYRSATDEIMMNFRFFPEGHAEPEGPFKTYINDQFKFLFIHPNMDTGCCSFAAPPLRNIKGVITIADKETFKDQNNFDGIGFFSYTFDMQRESLQSIVDGQKQVLIEDYKVVAGKDPETETTETKVGQYDALMLKGFSWRGDTLIYAKTPANNRLLIIMLKNITGTSFDEKVKSVLDTIEYY